MSFLDEGRFSNPLEAVMEMGGTVAELGGDTEDIIAVAEFMSKPVVSERDSRNIVAFAGAIVANPHYIRKESYYENSQSTGQGEQ